MNKKDMIEKHISAAYEKGGFMGSWLYAENGEIVSKGAVGFCDAKEQWPITEDTIFQLASVTKQFTAAAVMLLVRQGLLSLEDELTTFFPELCAYKGVTIRHLLSHTSGIPDYFDDADWFIRIREEEKRIPGNAEIVRFLCETKAKPYCVPGEEYHYSNTGYNLLAEIVERLSGGRRSFCPPACSTLKSGIRAGTAFPSKTTPAPWYSKTAGTSLIWTLRCTA